MNRRKSLNRRQSIICENLETRRLLSAAVAPAGLAPADGAPSFQLLGGVFVVTGTSGNDTFSFSVSGSGGTASIVGMCNSSSMSFASSSVTSVQVIGGGGADTVSVATGVPALAVTDNDGTTFNITAANGSTIVQQTGGTLAFTGTSGNDTVNLSTLGTTLSAALAGVTETLPVGSVNAITFNGAGGNDSITAGFGVPALTSVTDNGGAIAQSAGGLTLTGTTASDLFTLSESGNNLTASVDGITETVAASGVNAVTVIGGGGTDSVSTASGVPPLTVKDNNVTIAPNGATLSVVSTASADVTGISVSSSNLVVGVDGVTESLPSTGISAISLSGSGANTITLGTGIPPVTVSSNNGTTINGVNLAVNAGVLTITGTSGNDTVSLASSGSNLNATVAGATETLGSVTSVQFMGGGGTDSISAGTGVPPVTATDNGSSITLSGTTLNITGTGGSDVTGISTSGANLLVTIDGLSESIPTAGISSINLSGSTADTVTLGTGIPAVSLSGINNAAINGINVALSAGTLTITGTSGNDSLGLSAANGTLTATVSGASEKFTTASVTAIDFNGGGGSDSVTAGFGVPPLTVTDNGGTIAQSGTTLTITGTSGSDTVALSSASGNLTASVDGITETLAASNVNSISVIGGGGTDSVSVVGGIPVVTVADNGATIAPSGGALNITSTAASDVTNLSVSGTNLLVGIDGLTESTTATAVTAINLSGSGPNMVTLGTGVPAVAIGANNGTTINGVGISLSAGTLTITGTGGNDAVNLSITGSTLAATVSGATEKFTASSITAIDFNGGGGGSDSVTAGFGVPPLTVTDNGGTIAQSGTTLTITGTSGSDTVALSSVNGNLTASVDGITETLAASNVNSISVIGGGGTDSVAAGAGIPALAVADNGATVVSNGAVVTVSSTNSHDVSVLSVASPTLTIGIDGLSASIPSAGINGINLASTGSNAVTVGTGVPPVSLSGSNNTINGQTISENSGAVTITGTPGNDTTSLSVSNHNLVIVVGGASQNIPLAGLTSISMSMLAGNDTVSIAAGVPAVSVLGGGGNDTILAVNSANNTLSGGAGNDSIGGNGAGNNLLLGGAGHDTIVCGSGNNTLNGGLNYDSLVGGSGSDLLIGGPGTDVLSAGSGNNTLNGGKGNDTLLGGIGADLLNGGAGSNSIQPASPQSTIKGATAADSIVDGTTGTSQAISAQSNIYGAGFTTAPDPGGSTTTSGGGGGTLPPAFTFTAGSNQILTFSSVTGSVSLNGGQNHNGPDGNGSGQISSTSTGDSATTTGGTGGSGSTAATGISGITAPGAGYLVGIFETSAAPSGTAPASLNYLSGLSTSATDYYPLLDQVFYIGDGLTGTGSGAVQKFHVPAGATRLFLGISDAPGDGNSGTTTPGDYDDNSGFFTVTFKVAVPFFSE